jgi:2-polyprenyl-3-methyl-5-hydroxy-6-metoxy-1,4-benzoquinol methylase
MEAVIPAPVVHALDAVNRRHPWSHNDHYRRWVLRQVPPGATRVLDVGCGTGNLLRALARVVPEAYGIDRDPRAAALAGGTAADLLDLTPEPGYDVITAVAVLHHLPLRPALAQVRRLLNPGGRLVVVGCYRTATRTDHAVDLLAIPANVVVGLVKARHADAARHAMSAPTAPATDTLAEIRRAAGEMLPGATIRRRLFWRYTLTWTRPGSYTSPNYRE